MFASFFILPTPSSAPSRGAAKVIWLLILWHRTVCFCLIFFVMHDVLFSFCYTFSAGHFPPLVGLWVVPPFHCVLVFTFSSRPPATMVACGRVLTLVSLVIAPAFSFNSPFFVSPPHHAGGTREFFYDGLPYYSVCVSCTYFFAFFLAS